MVSRATTCQFQLSDGQPTIVSVSVVSLSREKLAMTYYCRTLASLFNQERTSLFVGKVARLLSSWVSVESCLLSLIC